MAATWAPVATAAMVSDMAFLLKKGLLQTAPPLSFRTGDRVTGVGIRIPHKKERIATAPCGASQ